MEQRLGIERLPIKLPRPGLVGTQSLLPTRGSCRGDQDREGSAKASVCPEPAAHLDPRKIGQLLIENHHVRVGGIGESQGLLGGEGPRHPEAVGRQNALDSPSRPLLVVGDQDQGKIIGGRDGGFKRHRVLVGDRQVLDSTELLQKCNNSVTGRHALRRGGAGALR